MRRLRDAYLDDERVIAAATALADAQPLTIGACHGGLIPVLVAAVLQRRGAQMAPLIVCNDPATLVDDLEELGVVAAHLPELERFDDGLDIADRSGHNRRLAALEAYTTGAVLVANPIAVEQPIPDLVDITSSSIIVKIGETRPLHQLVERLVEAGYRVTPVVEGRGELAVRGGIIDVYPWIGQNPLRIEFFDDRIEAIRRFDAFTQESIARCDEAILASSRGGLALKVLWTQLPPGPIIVIADLPLAARLKHDPQRVEVRFARQLEEGAHDGASVSVERLRGDLRHGLVELRRISTELRGAAEHVLILVRNEEAKLEIEANCRDAGLQAQVRLGRLSAGFRDQQRSLVVVHDFELAERTAIKRRGTRIAGGAPLSSLSDLKRGDLVVHLRHGIGMFKGMATLEKRGFLEDFLLLEFAQESRLYVPVDAIDLVQKYVGASSRVPELSLIGGAAWAKKRARAEKAIHDMSAELLQSQAARLAISGIAFLADTPAQRRFESAFPYEETEDQLAAVREIKADMERPVAMDRLLCGDVGFGKTEVAMRAAFKACASGFQVAVMVPTTLLAEQHLETFGERFATSGFGVAGVNRFRTGTDRAKVISGVASGDVQILIGTHAILTDKLQFKNLGLLIIDEEHRFGVKHKEKLRALATGQLALADARSVKPPDVLTLSATPIPRTLHFSLLGLRDISVLAEAPAERMAVETRVAPWDEQLIRHAIERELERHGQIFVVHNRVTDLDALAFRLARLVPSLRLDLVHGQMDEDRLWRVMEAFRHRELDCLVTTSIIESGIDIPNANTLFVNNAHCFGLAELHQIRGRIGRFSRQAYAYFLTPNNRELTTEANERLNAIQEYAELGAGFKLAMRDLELRGAGNLLGAEQSGQIDAIGYELYTKLLTTAVAHARSGGKTQSAPGAAPAAATGRTLLSAGQPPNGETTLVLAVDAYIPDTYLETPALKFEVHKQLDSCRRISDLAAIAHSVRDRYGPMVDPVVRLFQMRAIRIRSLEMGIRRIEIQDRQVRLLLDGALPAQLAKVKMPELVHLQLDGKVLVLFMKTTLEPDPALNLLCRLLALDLGFLGRGF